MGDKRLSDVIKWDKHIEPYRVIEVVSGVGSGKSYWVENDLMQQYRVLLITSRKKKVEETKERTKLNTCINLTLAGNDALCALVKEDKEKSRQCICNNWQIEYYVKNTYNPDDPSTFLWNCFDIIVLDEAHSMATDATFADAPFHTWSFLSAAYRNSNVKIILMTATPNPISGLFNPRKRSDYKLWNFSMECISVAPHNIWITTSDEIIQTIARVYQHNKDADSERIVYFVNSIDRIKQIMDKLVSLGIPEEAISFSYSGDEKNSLFTRNELKRKAAVETYIPAHEKLPDGTFIFLTTTRNKEGINLSDESKRWQIVTESHYPDEIMQMWGRARHHLGLVFIVCDAYQHPSIFCHDEPSYLVSKHGISAATEALAEWCIINELNIAPRSNHIKYHASIRDGIRGIEKELPFIRYDYFKTRFTLYRGRIEGQKSFSGGKAFFKDYVDWRMDNSPYATVSPLFNVKVRFTSSAILYYADEETRSNIIRSALHEFFEENHFYDKDSVGADEEKKIADYLYMLGVKRTGGKKYSNVTNGIRPFGFELAKKAHRAGARTYVNDLRTQHPADDQV